MKKVKIGEKIRVSYRKRCDCGEGFSRTTLFVNATVVGHRRRFAIIRVEAWACARYPWPPLSDDILALGFATLNVRFSLREIAVGNPTPSVEAASQRQSNDKPGSAHTIGCHEKTASVKTGVRIGSWNALTLRQSFRQRELVNEMRTRMLGAICLQETRWSEPPTLPRNFVANIAPAVKGRGGVAIVTAPNVEVDNFKVHSPSIISAFVGGVCLVCVHFFFFFG
jgi:hypothetical protein